MQTDNPNLNPANEYNTAGSITGKKFSGERILFAARDLSISDTVFGEGESPLKEAQNIQVDTSLFQWKYPFWYTRNVHVRNSAFYNMARAGIWYSENFTIEDSVYEAPKGFRRCKNLTIRNVSIPDAAETLWNCSDVTIDNMTASGSYFAMNMENSTITGLTLYGDYCFDGAKNITFDHCKFLSKDCLWNTENVTVKNSFISGEYIGWNARNLTLENCTIESLQGFCYIDNLKLIHCKLLNTSLAFEFSSVDADITSSVDSVLNPTSGSIRAESIGELILEKDKIDPSLTKITVRA